MQMNGLNGLITIGARWREWQDPRLVVAVLNNGDLNQVTWEQRVLTGDPKYEASQVLPAFDYARYAELVGLQSIRVERDEDVAPAWERALAAERPGPDRRPHRSRTCRRCRRTSTPSRRFIS